VAPAGLLAVTGHYAVIDFQTGGPSLSDWWSLRPSAPQACRPLSLDADFDFAGGPFTCYDYWQGGAVGGTTMDVGTPYPNRGRIKVQSALPVLDPRIGPVLEGVEVYAFKLIINNDRTIGPEACGGCTDEVCLVLQYILVTQVPGLAFNVTLQSPVTAHHVIWQGWSTTDPVQQCPAVTPVRNRTWGAIKAIYR
jgi:hypothetical protein